MHDLYTKAEQLAGRPVEVEKTKDGKYIVLFMVLGQSPPPKCDTEQEALEKFIEWLALRAVAISALPVIDTEEENRPAPKDGAGEF